MIQDSNFDFMAYRKIASIASISLIVVSLISLAINSLQFGLDFTSGTSVRLSYAEPVEIASVNTTLEANGYTDAVVVRFGSDRDIRVILPVDEEIVESDQAAAALAIGEELVTLLRQNGQVDIDLLGSDYVSAKVGEELAEQGGLGMLVALGIIMVYIAVRFQFKFSVGAVAALAHDIIITLGIFSLFNIEFNLNTLAALLAIVGYSLNDTIVVSDRIRENFRRLRKGTPIEMVNISLNQTLGRTLITSLTTLLVLVAILLVGGEATQGFALALIIGVVVGTYSSIYVASNIIIAMNITKEDLMIPIKEGSDLESTP